MKTAAQFNNKFLKFKTISLFKKFILQLLSIQCGIAVEAK
jgi:hypothetical protein